MNKIKGLENLDTSAMPEGQDVAEVSVSGEASINASEVSINLKPTIDERAFKQTEERVAQQIAYINSLMSKAASKTEVGKKGSYVSSAGFEAINLAKQAFEQNGNDPQVFKEELQKQLNNGRSKSGNSAMRKAAEVAAKQFNTLTIDVENTFSENGITKDILSVSSKHSSANAPTTLIRKDYKKLIVDNIKYWASRGNSQNVGLLEEVKAGLEFGEKEAKAGNPNYQLVTASQMRNSTISTINSNPTATIQGVNFSTDVSKLTNFIGGRNQAATSALTNQSRLVSLDDMFSKYFGVNQYTPGKSLTHMGDLLGILPGKSTAHEAGYDVRLTEQIGGILHSISEYEKALAVDNKAEMPPLLKSLNKRLAQSSVVEAYRGRVIANSALQHLSGIASNGADSIDVASDKAVRLVENVETIGKLVDFKSPEYNLPATSLGSKKNITAEQQKISRRQIASKDLVPIDADTDGLEKYAMLQAVATVKHLGSLNYGDTRGLSDEHKTEIVTDALYDRMSSDLSNKIKTKNGKPTNGISDIIDLDKIVSSVESLVLNNGKFTTGIGSLTSPDTIAFAVDGIKNRILRTLSSGLKHNDSDIFLDKKDTSLPEYAFDTITTSKEQQLASSRSTGLKSVSKYILDQVSPSNGLVAPFNKDTVVSNTLRHIENGMFPSVYKQPELKDSSTARLDAYTAYSDYISKGYMHAGTSYEKTAAPGKLLESLGYSLVKPTVAGNNPYEHAGVFGTIEAHPDALAHTVVPKPDGSLERRYLLPDIKSPAKYPGKNVNSLDDLVNDTDKSQERRGWLAQIIAYAQTLPEEIRKYLDIGILTGGEGKPDRLFKAPYSQIANQPVWSTFIDTLNSVKVGSAAHLDTLPSDMPKAGVVSEKDISANELNNVNRLINEKNNVHTKYIDSLLSLTNKREKSSQGELKAEYNKQNTTGTADLKSTLASMYDERIFGDVTKDEFAARSMTMMLNASTRPKDKRKEAIVDDLTNSEFKINPIFADLLDLSISSQSTSIGHKVSATSNTQLQNYFNKVNASINEFWAGAFSSEGLQGRKISRQYAQSLREDVANPANTPGALSFEDAERRARVEKSLLANYNRADLEAQNLVFAAEAKKTAIGTTGESNFLHEATTPGYNKKVTDDKTITYEEQINRAIQQKDYYGSQLELFKGSSSAFDVLSKLKSKEDTKTTASISEELNRVLLLLDAVNNSSGETKGRVAFQYQRAHNRLSSYGNSAVTSMVPNIADVLEPENTDFTAGYSEAKQEYIDKKQAYNPALISQTYIDKLKAKQEKLSLDSQLNAHVASYISNFSESGFNLGQSKANLSENQAIEAKAIDDFIKKYSGSKPDDNSSIDPVLLEIQGEREGQVLKLQNNYKKAFKTADHYGLSASGLKELVGTATELSQYGLGSESLASLLDQNITGTGRSKQLQNISNMAKLHAGGKVSQESYFKEIEGYASALSNAIVSLSPDSIVSLDSKFKELGRSIEQDIFKLQMLDEKIQAAKDNGLEVDAADSNKRVEIFSRLNGHQEELNLLSSPTERLDYLRNKKFSTSDEYTTPYRVKKADKLSNLHETMAGLSITASEGDLATSSEDILASYAMVHKQYRKLGEKPLGGSVSLSDLILKAKGGSIGEKFGIEGDLTNKGVAFISSVQSLNSGSELGVNKFDLIIEKEKAALAAAKELQAQFLAISKPELSGVEKEFSDLLRIVEADIVALNKLENAKKASGETYTPEAQKELDKQKSVTQSNVSNLLKMQQQMVGSGSTIHTQDDWKERIKSAGSERSIRDRKLDSEALEINALIASSKDPKSGKYNATYAEFEQAIRLAKDRESRGIKPNSSIGFLSSTELESWRAVSGHKGQQHLSFAEGLVDQAAWKVQWGGAGAVLGGLGALTVGGFAQAKAFEADMKNVELVSQASTVQLDALEQKVISLSTTFQNTPAQLSEGLVVLGQAGYKAAESLQLLGPIAQLATATMSDLKQAADITTTVLMSFDEPVSNVAKVTNTLAAATIESKLELSSLGTVLNYVASTAYMAGMSLEETETAMGLMSNAGVKASTIGTSLRSIFGSLISPTAAFSAELARVGLSAEDINPQLNSMSTILQRMSFKGFNVEHAFAGLDKRIAGNIATLLTQADKWENFKSRITNTDTASMMAIGQMDTFDAQSKRMSNTFDAARIAINEPAMSPLKDGAKVVSWGLEGVEKLAKTSVGHGLASFLTTSMAIGAGLSGIGGLFAGAKTIWPGIADGARETWSKSLVRHDSGKLYGVFNSVSPDSSVGKWLTATSDVKGLSPNQQRMHGVISSMVSVPLQLPLLAATGLATAGYYGYKWAEGKDAGPFGKGLERYERSKRVSDNFSNYTDTLKKAAEQETRLKYFDRGTSTDTLAFESGLLSTGVFIGRDIAGNLETPGYGKNQGKLELASNRNKLDLKAAYSIASHMDRSSIKPALVESMLNRGVKSYGSLEKATTDEGQQYIAASADTIVSHLQSKGIFYDSNKTGEYLSKTLSGTDFYSAQVKKSVIEKQDFALKASDADSAKRGQLEVAYAAQLETVKNSEVAVLANNGAVLTGSQQKRANAVQDSVVKSLVQQYRGDEAFKKATDKNGAYSYLYKQAMQGFDEGRVSADALGNIMEVIAANTGSKQGINAKKDIKEGTKQYTTTEGLAKLKQELDSIGEDMILASPADIMNKEQYSTARAKFIQDNVTILDKLMNAQKSLDKSKKLRDTIGDKSSQEYKTADKRVAFDEVMLERSQAEAMVLGERSMIYSLPNVDKNHRKFLADTRGALGVLNPTALQSLGSGQYDEFAEKIDKLTVDFRKRINSSLAKDNEPVKKKLQLQYELEVKETLNQMLLKNNEDVFKHSEQLTKVLKINLDTSVGLKNIKLEDYKLSSDIEASNIASNMLLSKRTETSGYDSNYTKYFNNTLMTNQVDNSGGLNIASFSQDTMFLVSADARVSKLKESLKSTVSVLNDTKASLNETLAQDKSSLTNLSSTSVGNEKLLEAEERYAQGRIAANQKAFGAIKQVITEELQLREQLVTKMAKSGDSQADFARELKDDRKSLAKAAGYNTNEDPRKLLDSLKEKEYKYNERVSIGDVEGAKQIYSSMKNEELKELKSGNYAPAIIMEASKTVEGIEAKNPELYKNYNNNLAVRLNSSTENLTDARAKLSELISDSIVQAKAQGLISAEKADLYRSKFNKSLEAASGNPELMNSVISEFNNTPILQQKIGDSVKPETIVQHLGSLVAESGAEFANLKTSTQEVVDAFQELSAWLRNGGIDGKDVTPNAESIKSMIGSEAYKELGLDSSSLPNFRKVDKKGNYNGEYNAQLDEVTYTDRKSLIHELTHRKLKAEGKTFAGGTDKERELAEEFEVNKRMVGMGQLSRFEVEDRFGIGLNADSSNLSREQIDSLMSSRAGKTYAAKDKRHSLNDIVGEYYNPKQSGLVNMFNAITDTSSRGSRNNIDLSQEPNSNAFNELSNASLGRIVSSRDRINYDEAKKRLKDNKYTGVLGRLSKLDDEKTVYFNNTDDKERQELAVRDSFENMVGGGTTKILTKAQAGVELAKKGSGIAKLVSKPVMPNFIHTASSPINELHDGTLFLSSVLKPEASIARLGNSSNKAITYGAEFSRQPKVFDFTNKSVENSNSFIEAFIAANKGTPGHTPKTLRNFATGVMKSDSYQMLDDGHQVHGMVKKALDHTNIDMYKFKDAGNEAYGLINNSIVTLADSSGKVVPKSKSLTPIADTIFPQMDSLATPKSAQAPGMLKETLTEPSTASKFSKLTDRIPGVRWTKDLFSILPDSTKKRLVTGMSFIPAYYGSKYAVNLAEKKYHEAKINDTKSQEPTITEQHETNMAKANEVASEKAYAEAAKLTAVLKGQQQKKQGRTNALWYSQTQHAADSSLDEMRAKSTDQQKPYDIMESKGEAALRSYLKRKGLTKDEISSKVEEVKSSSNWSSSKPSNTDISKIDGIQLPSNNTNITTEDKYFNRPTLDQENNKDLFRQRYSNATNEYNQIKTNFITADDKVKQIGVNADAFTRDKDGSYSVSLGGQTTSFGKNSDEAKIIEAQKGYLKNPVPKFSLSDEAVKAPQTAVSDVVNTNDKLIAALDNLRASLEKGTGSQTGSQTAANLSVSVNAPITVSNASTGTFDASAVVSKICNDFFNNEFNARYIKAVQTVSV